MEFAHRVRVTGLKHLQRARESGRGAIVLSSNVGWKHLALVALKGQNVDEMMQVGGGMRTLGLIGLTQLKSQFLLTIEEDQIKSNSHLSYQLARGKQVLEHGGLLFIAGDGHRGQQKKEVSFLNRRRRFGTGFAELALTTDALVIPVFTSLRADGTAEVTFHPPLTVPDSERETQVRSLLEQYARLLEDYWKTDLPNVRWKQMKQYLSLPPK
jgi:lauroyl/myristoyl acyltransferase